MDQDNIIDEIDVEKRNSQNRIIEIIVLSYQFFNKECNLDDRFIQFLVEKLFSVIVLLVVLIICFRRKKSYKQPPHDAYDDIEGEQVLAEDGQLIEELEPKVSVRSQNLRKHYEIPETNLAKIFDKRGLFKK